MNSSETKVGSWLTRQGCHWIFVEQSAFSVADGAKRAKPYQQIHRPDLIAMMDGFGTIAIDVKSYDFQSSKARLEAYDENGEDFSADLPIHWVKLAWEDVCGLFEFQRVSNIPAWLCIIDGTGKNEYSAWLRIDYIYESFSRIFISESLGFYHAENRASLRYFPNWPEINLVCDPVIDKERETFQVLVEDPDHVEIIGLTDEAQKLYVPPTLINLKADSSLRDLINIWPAEEVAANAATERQMAFAMAISAKLQEPLPQDHDKESIHKFISGNIHRFRKS